MRVIKTIIIKYNGTGNYIWEKLTQLREETKGDGRVNIHTVSAMSLEYVRNLIETIFQGSSTRITVQSTSKVGNDRNT